MTKFPLDSLSRPALLNAPSVKFEHAEDFSKAASHMNSPVSDEAAEPAEDERPRSRGSLQNTAYIRTMTYSQRSALGLVSPRTDPAITDPPATELDETPDMETRAASHEAAPEAPGSEDNAPGSVDPGE